jgi:hypothetical protein
MGQQIETSNLIDDLECFKLRFGFKNEVTTCEFSQAFKISKHTVRDSRYKGTLLGIEAPKHFKIGRTSMYKAVEIMNWQERAKTQNI